MVDLDELESLLNSEGCELQAIAALRNAAEELIRDARRWREHEELMMRFIRCEGVVYEVTTTFYATGPSPLYSIEEVRPVDIPGFTDTEAK